MNIPGKLRCKLGSIPDQPGCYLMRDARGRIIYVGKAVSLRKRVQSYFREGALRRGSPKLRSLVHSIADVEVLPLKSEAEAVLTEGRLIKDFKPYFNVSFRDDKRFLLLRADPAEPFPRWSLCRIRRSDGAVYFGPYASSGAARATLDFVEKRFGLRKCAPRVPGRETYRHCLNDIVRHCSAPCIGNVSRADYRARFEEARAFLRGERREILKELQERMQEAASRRAFETAASLRDLLFSLRKTVEQRARMAPTPEMRQQDARRGLLEMKAVLRLPRIPGRIEAFDISNTSGTQAVAGMVCFENGRPRRSRYRRFRIRTAQESDDPAMMAEAVQRRFARRSLESVPLPDLVLVDGGRIQLRAVRATLNSLGLSALPSAGLAKRLEEIHLDEGLAPIRLPSHSQALRLLQRVRDEAHRFALTYHRTLRARRLRESTLDAVPGIGPKRKAFLLKTFGSVRRLAAAEVAEVAAVPGIGPATAAAICLELQAVRRSAPRDDGRGKTENR